jgi:hypothetical protein
MDKQSQWLFETPFVSEVGTDECSRYISSKWTSPYSPRTNYVSELEDELEWFNEYENKQRIHEELGESTKKAIFKYLSFLPHSVEVKGKDASLTPSSMDPKIYNGSEKYKISPMLQNCLNAVIKQKKFSHIKVALVDLTKNKMQPEFAASLDHKEPVFVASISKIAAMLAAFQLRQDVWVLRKKGAKTLKGLFELLRKGLADTQKDPGGKATSFTKSISFRGKLILVGGRKIPLSEPKSPRLENIFASDLAGSTQSIKFRSTGENKIDLENIVNGFNELEKAKDEFKKAQLKGKVSRVHKQRIQKAQKEFPEFKKKLNNLGFFERMGIMVGGDVPASNFATSTIVRDVGYLYIALTLLQSGLYDTNRGGGIWLGADYWGSRWRVPLGGGSTQNATTGSLAAFMTLLVQNCLVSPWASFQMGLLMQKVPTPNHFPPGTGSWFWNSVSRLQNGVSLKTVLAKVGLGLGGSDDFAFIEREVNIGSSKKKLLRYVAVGLRAKKGVELEQLILELDKCILVNNGLTPSQGGHPT